MPDYEIRLFNADGTLAIVHMSHHDSDDDAVAQARGLIGGHARYEIRCGNRELATGRR
jgi:hypothetical protein